MAGTQDGFSAAGGVCGARSAQLLEAAAHGLPKSHRVLAGSRARRVRRQKRGALTAMPAGTLWRDQSTAPLRAPLPPHGRSPGARPEDAVSAAWSPGWG